MKSDLFRVVTLLGVFCFGIKSSQGADLLSPKFSFRLSNGIIQTNEPTVPSTTFLGGFDLQALFFFSEKVALGLGYTVDFNNSTSSIPFYGPTVNGRYYFWNEGTFSRVESEGNAEERESGLAAYGSFGALIPSYNLNSTATPGVLTNVSGSSFSLNAGIGAEWRWGRHWEATAEISAPFFSFAFHSGDLRVSAELFYIGINYIW